MRNPVMRVAAIHDLSGFGRTSLTVAIPVLSAMGIQVCPLPTAVLSTHTSGFSDFTFVDLSASVDRSLDHWEALGLSFDAVYSGFLGSPGQVESVMRCIDRCRTPDGLAVVDPVLGDHGVLEPTMGEEMIFAMRRLIRHADLITPNLTEAAFLLGEEYPAAISNETVCEWLVRLTDFGPETAIITSVPTTRPHVSSVVAFSRTPKRFWKVDCNWLPAHYPGTGDTFTSVLTGSLLAGDSLPVAMDRAVQFVTTAIRTSFGYDLPGREGILLERVLDTLRAPVLPNAYELLTPGAV